MTRPGIEPRSPLPLDKQTPKIKSKFKSILVTFFSVIPSIATPTNKKKITSEWGKNK